MITLNDIKSYLKIDTASVTHDAFLLSLIGNAKGKIESYCNRSFEYETKTEYYDGDGWDTLYVKGYPINSISELKYYDSTSGDYTDLISEAGDTIANSVVFSGNEIELRKSYLFFESTEPKNIKIIYTSGYKAETGTGNMSITAGTKAVTGSGTAFLTELTAGDTIQCDGQTFKVDTITSNTVMTVTKNAVVSITAKGFSIKNTPADLQQVMLEMVTMMFQDSAQGKGRLGIASENVGSQAAQSYSFKEMDWNVILDKYKDMNI